MGRVEKWRELVSGASLQCDDLARKRLNNNGVTSEGERCEHNDMIIQGGDRRPYIFHNSFGRFFTLL